VDLDVKPLKSRARAARWTPATLAVGLASAVGLAATLAATPARAQSDILEDPQGRRRDYHSAQNFALELRFSPYKPDIDSDPKLNGATPYKNVFGNNVRLLAGAEFDWQALRIPHVGSLGPGVSGAYTSITDPASFKVAHNGTTVSGETTTLQIFPFKLMAVFRLDVLNHDVGIPLVPYAKLGLGYAFWRASNTGGTSNFQGIVGTGQSWGWNVAAGLAFDLNPFDPYAAQNIDDALGINHTYIFAEFDLDEFTGLGFQSDPLRVGGPNWFFGLTFEF
jgi:hypothetical protein